MEDFIMRQLTILTENEIQKIHEHSLHLLEKTGVYFWNNTEALDIFKNRGCRVEESRVFIPKTLTEECLKTLPKREGLSVNHWGWLKKRLSLERANSNMMLVGNVYYTADYGAKEARVATNEDANDKDDIINSLSSFVMDGSTVYILPGYEEYTKPFFNDLSDAQGVAEVLLSRLTRRGLQYHSKNNPRCPHYWRPEGYQKIEQLSYAILEGSEAFTKMMEDSQPGVWVNPISPMQYETSQIASTIRVSRHPRGVIWISPECMMGMTSPVTLAGTALQQNTEVLGMTVLAQLVNPGTTCIYGSVSCVTDLRNAEVSHGSYETQLLHVAAVQLADYYGMPSRIAPGNTNALIPGTRAASETALGLYMGMAAGANIITTGLINSTLTLSLEHLVVLDELFKQYEKNSLGFDVNDETLAMDVIQEEGHPSPNYIINDHTIDHKNRDVYYSPWTGRSDSSYEDWYQHAHTKVQEILNTEQKPNDNALERYKLVCARLKENMSYMQNGDKDWWRFYIQNI
jgi:trimethylamine--corrinoid protein Co-methyltransferase